MYKLKKNNSASSAELFFFNFLNPELLEAVSVCYQTMRF